MQNIHFPRERTSSCRQLDFAQLGKLCAGEPSVIDWVSNSQSSGEWFNQRYSIVLVIISAQDFSPCVVLCGSCLTFRTISYQNFLIQFATWQAWNKWTSLTTNCQCFLSKWASALASKFSMCPTISLRVSHRTWRFTVMIFKLCYLTVILQPIQIRLVNTTRHRYAILKITRTERMKYLWLLWSFSGTISLLLSPKYVTSSYIISFLSSCSCMLWESVRPFLTLSLIYWDRPST